MTEEARWTLDELVGRVAVALAGPAYPGAPNARVRDVPDRRAVRWYATIGLVDRPVAMQGRTALYGPRHLLQLVAVKRRQADGASLAEIQAELTGATAATLRRIARVPDELFAPGPLAGPAIPAATGLTPAGPASITSPGSASTISPEPVGAAPEAGERRARFWAEPAALATTIQMPVNAGAVTVPTPLGAGAAARSVAAAPTAADGPATLTAVPLPGGALLLLPAHPDADDIAAIQAAARPLLDLLAGRGLLP